jgi:beta-galactosidase
MANTNFNKFLEQLLAILQYNDNTGSVNLYMAHGGTNFGWTAGARVRLSAPVALFYSHYHSIPP